MSESNHSDGQARYYIRARGKVLGPFDLEKLKVLRTRGQLSRVHQVSTDRKSWQAASVLSEVFPSVHQDQHEIAERVDDTTSLSIAGSEAPVAPTSFPSGWYYFVMGEQRGPVSTTEMRSLINGGHVSPETLVWRQGFAEWLPLSQIPELQPEKEQLTSSGPSGLVAGLVFCYACGSKVHVRAEICPKCGVRQLHNAGRPGGRNRTTAGLLALLVGGLGLHRIYLGHVFLGLVYLFFCWTFIPGLIALVEGIIFLAMTDQAFAAKYDRS